MNSTATLAPSTSPYPGVVGGAQKRKLFEMEPTMMYMNEPSSEYYESTKRTMFTPSSSSSVRIPMMTGGRQRQESGSSVSSTSSWSSTSSYSSVSSSSSSSSCPGLAYPTSTSASAAARFRASPKVSTVSRKSATVRSPTPPSPSSPIKPTLYDICDAIELHAGLQHALKGRSIEETTTVAAEGDYELKFVFVAPNWLQDHVAKAKKAVSMKQK
ncbi:hypothetical protein BGZ83_001139 [Gryganskiella cystojenkinii]|nr:hypothetical protein BGZ83_001139 [Gryganskiella cystojenkinii]